MTKVSLTYQFFLCLLTCLGAFFGAALLGRQEGDTVVVTAPAGEFALKVLHIEQ